MKRRQFLHLTGSAAAVGMWGNARLVSAASENTMKKPNIVFILVDDLGYSDLGCYGSTFYDTPHLDALAKQGRYSPMRMPRVRCVRPRAPA